MHQMALLRSENQILRQENEILSRRRRAKKKRLRQGGSLILAEGQSLQDQREVDVQLVLENPGIPLPFRIQTVSQKVLDLEFKVLDEII